MQIARRGGGIHSSVRDLRAMGEDELLALTRERVARLASYGTTTIEMKSGYGLDIENELKSLRVIAPLQTEINLRLVPTWLGAHEIPLEYRERANGRATYIALLINEMLPRVVAGGLARFADVFCEPGVFTIDETRATLEAARAAGLAIKLHAAELDPRGGAELAAPLGATSANHLAAISPSSAFEFGEICRIWSVASVAANILLVIPEASTSMAFVNEAHIFCQPCMPCRTQPARCETA